MPWIKDMKSQQLYRIDKILLMVLWMNCTKTSYTSKSLFFTDFLKIFGAVQ